MFICLDGVDGAGKTTQARMLFQRFCDEGLDVELVSDPGTTQIGKAIRHILLDTDAPITASAQMLLFSAARAELGAYIQQKISAGSAIICDRWLLSTLVYQSDVNGVDEKLIYDIFFATGCPIPNMYLVLDVAPDIAHRRIASRVRQDRYERNDVEHFKTLRGYYIRRAVALSAVLAKTAPSETYILQTEKSVESLHEEIYSLCQSHVFHGGTGV